MMESLPEGARELIQQLKDQGMQIDENNPQQVMQVLAYVSRMTKKIGMLPPAECPKGSAAVNPQLPTADATHFTKHTPLYGPFEGKQEICFGMGCFWCSEDVLMALPGVYSTQVGYLGGETINPTYDQVCGGNTNHNEVTRVVYEDPATLAELLKIFWETHDSTTAFQQGGDRGTQYRSGIYWTTDEQRQLSEKSKEMYQSALNDKFGDGTKTVSTEIMQMSDENDNTRFWMGEDYHQQYDAKPVGQPYCGLQPLGVSLPGPITL